MKPKEKILLLAKAMQNGEIPIQGLVEFYGQAKDPEKGFCLSAITSITKDNPGFIKDPLDFIISQINYKAPRVKWQACEIIANASKKFPQQVVGAIPRLLETTKDEGTVVRWSAALGLTEIAKNNPQSRKELLPFIERMAESETQSGIKKIYIKALKALLKEK